jgi:citrate lyase beta subunit
MPLYRSLLILNPARPVTNEQIAGSTADIVAFDLASVTETDLTAARVRVGEAITSFADTERPIFVRVHAMDSGETAADLADTVRKGLGGIILPRVREPRDVRQFDVLIREYETRNQVRAGDAVLVPEIATARALLRAQEIVEASSRVAAAVLDVDAYCADLGIDLGEGEREIDYARQHVVAICVAERVAPLESAGGSASLANQFGFRGKYTRDAAEAVNLNQMFRGEFD